VLHGLLNSDILLKRSYLNISVEGICIKHKRASVISHTTTLGSSNIIVDLYSFIQSFALRHGINIYLIITSSSSSCHSAYLGMPVHAESMLGLVHEALLGATMNSLVLAAAEFVVHLLGGRLAGVGLGTTSDLVGATGDGLLGFIEGGLGRVWGLGGNVLV
jgi:hypothetical protein